MRELCYKKGDIINQVLHGALHVFAEITFFSFYLRVILI